MPDPAALRPAATVILLRRGGRHRERALEVLLVRRNPGARFMPGVWVFPGGAVDADELIEGVAAEDVDVDADELAHRVAAVRELREEAGIELAGPAELLAWSRWVTPEAAPIRFDTRFYVALAPAHSPPRPDGLETVAAEWMEPSTALEKGEAGEIKLVFPTIKHLESLLPFARADEVIAAARELEIEPVLPRVVLDGEGHRVVLPGEPGY